MGSAASSSSADAPDRGRAGLHRPGGPEGLAKPGRPEGLAKPGTVPDDPRRRGSLSCIQAAGREGPSRIVTATSKKPENVIVRFAGDSGDGMQLVGDRFTAATAHVGNDLSTLPDFPAEIRAPAGTPGGVSAFQIHFASRDILTPGDHPNTLVAMNPAAVKAHLGALQAGGTLIVNEDAFTAANLRKAGYESNPLEDGTVEDYQVFKVPMTTLTTRATEDIEGLKPAEAQRTKNLFALGLISWLYGRPRKETIAWLETKFAKRPAILAGNIAAFKAGYNFGDTTEIEATPIEVAPAPLEPGEYRNINGANALAMGLIAASVRSGLQLFFASYPITPASELLHHLARHNRFGVRTVQAEDELAAANMALGASFGGKLGVTSTSGPGMDLKAETIALAQMVELPLVVIDVQRSGPSTGLPTKTEQSDLLMAIHGRHGESPLPVIAADTPAGCFDSAIEAARIAIRYRTPVILLADTFLMNSSEPWRLPDVEATARDRPRLRRGPERRRRVPPLPARRARRPAVGDPRHPGPAAPARRAREGARLGQGLLRPGQPRADDPPARREAGEAGRGAAAAAGRRRRGRRAAGARLGLDLGRDRRRRRARARARDPDRDRAPAPARTDAGQHRRGGPRPSPRSWCRS